MANSFLPRSFQTKRVEQLISIGLFNKLARCLGASILTNITIMADAMDDYNCLIEK